MAHFKKPSRFNGNSSRPPFRGGRPEGKDLHTASCNKCQKQCQVPFRPNGKKPVYCADCFIRPEGSDSYARPERTSFAPRREEFAPRAPQNDPRIDELTRKVDAMAKTLETLVVTIETFNRATALTNEIRKHFPADKPAPAPKKVVAKKTATKAAPKKSVKKTAKKV